MPTFRHGKDARVMFGGHNLTRRLNEAGVAEEVSADETTTFAAPGHARTYQAGLEDGTVSLAGLFDYNDDSPINSMSEIMRDVLKSEDRGYVILPEGDRGVGSRSWMGVAQQTSYDVTSPIDGVVNVDAELQADGGVDGGVYLRDEGASPDPKTTASGNAGDNSASHDNGASTSSGLVLHVQVVANTLDGDCVVTLQDSPDDTTWAGLASVTFAAGETGHKTAEVAEGTTVAQFLRSQCDTSAATAGSADVAVAVQRTPDTP